MRHYGHTPDDFDVAMQQVASATTSPTMTQLLSALHRSRLSTRRLVTREANRRGLLAGLTARVRGPLNRATALMAAADSADGRDPYQECAVADHWKPLFKRAFVKAAMYASHTDRDLTVRG